MSDEQSPPWVASAKGEPERLVPRTAADRARFARAQGVHGNAPLSDATLARLRAAFEAGQSRNAAARSVGVSPSVVSKYARQWGHSFDRSATQAATQARTVDMRAARVELADLLVTTALDEARRREHLAGDDTRARADLSRSAASLVRAALDIDAAEIDRAKVEIAARDTAAVDGYLAWVSGEATGTDDATVTPIRPGGQA